MCLQDAGAVVWACVTVSVGVPAGVLVRSRALLCADAGAVFGHVSVPAWGAVSLDSLLKYSCRSHKLLLK